MPSLPAEPPPVSIIIPSLNSPLIDRAVDSLRRQTASSEIAEILIVGLDDGAIIPSDPLVRFVRTDRPVTAPVARNTALRMAKGSVLAFIDADCQAEPEWLEQLLLAYRQGHLVVGGAISVADNDYWQLCYNLTMFHDFLVSKPAGTRPNLGTLNLCVSREVLERVGLFDETLDRSQDTEWTLRMRRSGCSLHFHPSAVVRHLPFLSGPSAIVRLWYRSGSFSARIRRGYPDLLPPPPFGGHPVLLSVLAPAIAAAVTARIFASDITLLKYLHTLPVVYATKIAWCLGARQQGVGTSTESPP